MSGRIRIRRDNAALPMRPATPASLFAVGEFVLFEHFGNATAIGHICRVISIGTDTSEGALSLHTYGLVRVLTGEAIPGKCPEHQLGSTPEFLLGAAIAHLDNILDALQSAIDGDDRGYILTTWGNKRPLREEDEEHFYAEDEDEDEDEDVPPPSRRALRR